MAKKLSLRPAVKSEEQQMADFVAGANTYPPNAASNSDFVGETANLGGSNEKNKPWEDPRVRDDVIKMVSLRLPEPYIIKLQYLSEKTHLSQQELLRQIVLPYLDAEVQKY